MIAKKNRLNLALEKNSAIFSRESSKFASSNSLLAYFRPNDQQLLASCLVPKTIFKKASKRNFYRRLLYSFLEKAILSKAFSLEKKIDLVIVLKRDFNTGTEVINLEKDFNRLLQKIENEISR